MKINNNKQWVHKMRVTKKHLTFRLKVLADLLGKKCGSNEGEWALDNCPLYGGWIVVEYVGVGGIHHPLINRRVNARTMNDMLYVATAAVIISQKGAANE